MSDRLTTIAISAATSALVWLACNRAPSLLPVAWQYDQQRAEDRVEAERERARQEYVRTNASNTVSIGSNVYFTSANVFTISRWVNGPDLTRLEIEFGYRADGVLIWRRPPENPMPKSTNNIPLL